MSPVILGTAIVSVLLTAGHVGADSGTPNEKGMDRGGKMMRGSETEHRGMMRGSDAMNMSEIRHRFVMKNGIPQEYESKTNPLTATEAHTAAGKQTYEANCAACHGASGRGDGVAGKNLDPSPTNIARFSKMRMASDAYLYWTIAGGGAPLGTAMPRFEDTLTERQIWQVIIYLRQM